MADLISSLSRRSKKAYDAYVLITDRLLRSLANASPYLQDGGMNKRRIENFEKSILEVREKFLKGLLSDDE